MTTLAQIVIPQYLTKVKTSNKRRAKYYTDKDDIPKKYKDLAFKKFKDKTYLIDEKGKKVIKNSISVGKPRFQALSGNQFSSGFLTPKFRSILTGKLKDHYRPYVQQYVQEHGPILLYPLKVTWQVYTTVEEDNWDISNFSFYWKYFEDCLFETVHPSTGKPLLPLIPNDTIRFITASPGPELIPIDDWEERKFVFTFYHDDRAIIQEHSLWQN